tara:strand:+ start:4053 stop:4580 length:528 start_codon:yes stop_codon:yes gene_type:complete
MLLNNQIDKIVKEEVAQLVSEMKSNLEKAGKGDSKLSKSIDAKFDTDGNVKVVMEDYGKFIDQGVSGKGASDFKGKRKTVHKSLGSYRFGSGSSPGGNDWKKKIDRWMSSKGISGGRDKLGNKISKDSINFLIRRSIYQHGIKGTLFASNAFESFQDELKERLSNIDFTNIIKTK